MRSVERPTVKEEVLFVIYDAECAFCRRWALRFERWGADRIALLPLQDERAATISGKTSAELERAMHLVKPDNTVFEGANAVREVLRYTAWGWLPRALFRLPGAMSVADRVYTWVALRRRRIGCGGEHCTVSVDPPGDNE